LRVTGADRAGECVELQLARQHLLDHDGCPDISSFRTKVPCTAASAARP
jgi:hypothetical protein